MVEFTTAPRIITIRERGQLTIPQDIREELKLGKNTPVTLFQVGNALIITSKRLQRASLARQGEEEMKRKGITLEELLDDLRTQRERYFDETYG
jgi:bifunctional DNA-binding transcriptional regulator/antitoxin component of YhaV-PrlF toxin-antitoxin module